MIDRVLSVRDRSWTWFKERADSKYAFWWLMLLAFLEPTISPIIPETLLAAMLLAGTHRWKFYAFWTTVSSIAGGVVGYGIGALFFKTIGETIINLYHLGPHMERAQTLFSENVFQTMFVVTSTPVPDKIFVFIAGVLGINFWLYFLGYCAGRGLRIFAIAWLLQKYGPKMLDITDRYLGWFSLAFLVLVSIALLDAFGAIDLVALLPWK